MTTNPLTVFPGAGGNWQEIMTRDHLKASDATAYNYLVSTLKAEPPSSAA